MNRIIVPENCSVSVPNGFLAVRAHRASIRRPCVHYSGPWLVPTALVIQLIVDLDERLASDFQSAAHAGVHGANITPRFLHRSLMTYMVGGGGVTCHTPPAKSQGENSVTEFSV